MESASRRYSAMIQRHEFAHLLPISILLSCVLTAAQSSTAPIEITVTDHGKPISPELFGIFFEDLSYAVDGGLYAELVQNRSFEYTGADAKGWNSLTTI